MKPQVVSYRKYKDFCNETFLDSLRHELNVQWQFLNEKVLDTFSNICTETFDKHAPKESDICDLTISLKNYFANLNGKNITDNKRFWKTVKLFLSKKIDLLERVNFTEEENNLF